MDLLSILQTNEPGRLLISYKGSEDARKAWEAKLLLFFEKGATSWKRQGRQFPFPLNVRFPIKFTLFDQSLILGATNPVGRKWNEIAFLHLFLMNPSSIDDYRNSVRNEVSEWFSLLNSVEGSQWLIIYDSSKARDRKNRGAVLERIKNDFPKFMDRIFEIYEGSLQTGHALELLVQSKLLNAVDSFVSYQEVQLSAKKEHFKDEDFDFIAYCTMQMNLSWLYHSLGILEHVLAKFDELDALLSLIVSHFSSTGNIPKWLASQANSIGHGCPLLMASIALKSPHEEMTLVELRTLFLAHQISFSLRIYYERIKHGSEPAQPNIKQLKTDFAAIILRYANHCLSSVYENLAALKLSYEPMELRCWTLAFCIEVSQFVGSLTESSLIENASHFACMLSVQKCHAITALSRMSRPEMSTYLSEWFESGVRRMVNSVDGSQAVSELRCLLTDETQIAHYMQKYHEGSIALLKHCDWKRQSMFMGWQLANFLLLSDRVEGAIPYLMKFIAVLIQDSCSDVLLRKTLISVVPLLEAKADLYFEELVDIYRLLSVRICSNEERECYCRKLYDLLSRSNSTRIRRLSYEISFACPVRVSIDGSCSRFVVIRGTKAHIRLVVDNVMPKSIPKFSATAIFKMVSADWMKTKRTAGHQPQFECAFHEVDGVNKFGCILKGEPICVDRNSEDPVLSAGVLDSDSETLTFHTDQSVTGDTDLVPGRTILTLVANADRVGVFAVDRIEISVLDSLDIVYAWQDLPEVEKDVGSRSLCFVHTKSAVVRLKPIKGRFLLAGITQVIYLEISPGSESHSPDAMKEISTLQIKALGRNGDVEFLNENESAWSTEYEKSIEILGPSENRLIPVYLCRCLRRNARKITDEEGNEDVADDLEQLLVKWNRSEWIFTLGFRPLMSMKIASSLLEEKVLIELEINREYGELWDVLPQDATLELIHEITGRRAQLLNPALTRIPYKCVYDIVWTVPDNRHSTKSESDIYCVRIRYRVKLLNESDPHVSEVPEYAYDRDYLCEDEFEITTERATYELCAQLLSSQPGAVLCRVDNACDLIVSLRSLTNQVETVIISVVADKSLWHIKERHKLLHVKESGLGQTSFSVVPKTIGFLPYPSIAVYGCDPQKINPERSALAHYEQSDLGAKLSSFVRTKCKQVHVLGTFNASTDHKSMNNEKSRRLKGAKNRITKLFE